MLVDNALSKSMQYPRQQNWFSRDNEAIFLCVDVDQQAEIGAQLTIFVLVKSNHFFFGTKEKRTNDKKLD